MPRTAVSNFARERKSLRSSSLAKKVEEKENSRSSTVIRQRSQTLTPSKRIGIRQVQTPSPCKKSSQSLSVKESPAKILAQRTQNSPVKSPRKKLFDESTVQCVSPKKLINTVQRSSPRKSPVKAAQKLFRPDVSKFAAARKALTSSFPDNLVGRQSQLKAMQEFLEANLIHRTEAKKGKKGKKVDQTGVKKSLYVSGPPGTGKTTCLRYLISNLPKSTSDNLSCVFLNCMALGSSAKVFAKIAEVVLPDSSKSTASNDVKKVLEDYIVSSKKLILLVLDEIDQLDSKSQEILYTLFEWPYLSNSKIILVGIANALDLTDRILPRISLRASIAPAEINFPAYSREEIVKIIASRIEDINTGEQMIIKPAAISFLAAKISTLSGDVRKALDVCRRAIELAELEARKQTLLKPLDAQTNTPSHVKPIDVPQILKIVNEVYCSSVTTSMDQKNSDLPLHQKLIIASLLLMMSNGKKQKEVTLAKLHETYSKVCKKRNMTAASLSEAFSMTQLLESRGFLSLKSAKQSKDSKLSFRIDEDEVEAAIQDKTLLSGILHDVECIAK